jgi:starch phosphorylase
MNILEYQVIPAYYARNEEGQSAEWLRMARASMKTILPRFNTIRMAEDYLGQSYAPAAREGRLLGANKAQGARELAAWKQRITQAWTGIRGELTSAIPDSINSGDPLSLEVALDLNGLQPDDVVVECVLGTLDAEDQLQITGKKLFMEVGEDRNGNNLFRCDLFDFVTPCSDGGLQHFKIRFYPCHHLLSHPLECGLMRWL